jgi:hypothetical protein
MFIAAVLLIFWMNAEIYRATKFDILNRMFGTIGWYLRKRKEPEPIPDKK